ncbi:MAG: hypothetical protein ACK5BQ_09925 [Ignavibacteria bacterium]
MAGLSLFALIALIVASCSSVQPVRVLEKDSYAVTGSLGGAFIPAKSPAGILPYLTVGGAHGVTDDLTMHGHAHLLLAALGVAGLDYGVSYRALAQNGSVPEVTVSGQLLMFAKVSSEPNPRVYPNFSANASWKVGESSLLYTGSHLTYQFNNSEVFVSPFVGYQFPVSKTFDLQIEGTWQAANRNTSAGVFEGLSSIGGMGSYGFYIGGVYKL